MLKLLDRRFPQQDDTDELAEVLKEVFSLYYKEGESLRQWSSRASEVSDKYERKGNVKMPEEARGFMLLKWGGLNEEQQAVVKGRSMGVSRGDEISRAMRSCYLDFVNNRKKAAALVQVGFLDSATASSEHDEVTGFDDVEWFIAEYVKTEPEDEPEYPEEEVAEVLATCHYLER